MGGPLTLLNVFVCVEVRLEEIVARADPAPACVIVVFAAAATAGVVDQLVLSVQGYAVPLAIVGFSLKTRQLIISKLTSFFQ